MPQCEGKQRYSKKDAQTVVNQRTQGRQHIRRHRPKHLRADHGPECNGWHLTHYNARKKNRPRS
jgi:hypothetical protein